MEFRRTYWTDQFFEVSTNGQVRTKAQMIDAQSKMNFATAEPDPTDFKLMAVYGNFALATDLTVVKMRDSGGQVVSTTDTRVLRMFVKENGNWKPAGAALVPIVSN
ncbi:MAG: nuclear transport factor 2 family protein [Candidatus Acidiferrales bacterium]